MITYNDRHDCRVNGSSFADGHVVHVLLEDWTSGVRPGNNRHLHYGLAGLAAVICRLYQRNNTQILCGYKRHDRSHIYYL